MDFITDILALIVSKRPPYSTIFVMLVSLAVSFFSTLLSRRMLDVEKLRRYTRETKEYQSKRIKALRSSDRKLLKYLEDNEAYFKKIQSELTFMRLRPLLYTFIPLMLVFFIMNDYFGTGDSVVAIIPFNLWDNLIIIPLKHIGLLPEIQTAAENAGYFIPSYIGWYVLTSITFGTLIQKIAGLTPD
jgi:uncharacterized membrane protein (DUF106 family)